MYNHVLFIFFIHRKQLLVVVTPQIVINAISNQSLNSLCDFSLLIFDECHHCARKHPYNKLMTFYQEEREHIKPKCLPQVLQYGINKKLKMNMKYSSVCS